MKASEFEAKLGTVSDAKLRHMLAASRSQGPEMAVSMILAEARKRGLADLDVDAPREGIPEWSEAAAGEAGAALAGATSHYPKEGAGAFGIDAPADSAAPALAPEWLTEETKSGMPMILKAFLLIAFVGIVLAVAWKYTR
jgi:hypothetical protein